MTDKRLTTAKRDNFLLVRACIVWSCPLSCSAFFQDFFQISQKRKPLKTIARISLLFYFVFSFKIDVFLTYMIRFYSFFPPLVVVFILNIQDTRYSVVNYQEAACCSSLLK